MYYKITGKGKAVILLHGFLEEGSMWNDVAKILSKKYKVIIPDLQGFGKSELKKQQAKISMTSYAEDIFQLLKKEKIKKCVLLGHSMGGYITLHFAEKHTEMLTGFGLINSHCFEDTPEKKINRKKGNDFIAKHGTTPFVSANFANYFHSSFKKSSLIKTLITQAAKYSPQALIAANTAMMNRKGKEDVLKDVAVPVLMINGKQDEVAPLHLTLKQASFPSIADIHFYNNCKHMSVFEKPKEAIKAMERFIDFCYL